MFTFMNLDELLTVEDLDDNEGIKSSSFYSGVLYCACVMSPMFRPSRIATRSIAATMQARMIEGGVGKS